MIFNLLQHKRINRDLFAGNKFRINEERCGESDILQTFTLTSSTTNSQQVFQLIININRELGR
jgi:hypothetical protein